MAEPCCNSDERLSAADSDRAIFAGWPGPRRARLIAEWPGPKARGSHTSDRGVARANGAGPARLIAAKGRPVGVVGWMHVLM